jgi:hypothetical protein
LIEKELKECSDAFYVFECVEAAVFHGLLVGVAEIFEVFAYFYHLGQSLEGIQVVLF